MSCEVVLFSATSQVDSHCFPSVLRMDYNSVNRICLFCENLLRAMLLGLLSYFIFGIFFQGKPVFYQVTSSLNWKHHLKPFTKAKEKQARRQSAQTEGSVK